MTFVVYLFALSIFFFALKDALSGDPKLKVKSEDIFNKFTGTELLFNKLSNVYDEDYGFLESSRIKNFDSLLSKYNPIAGYELYFKNFDNTAFTKIDYCIFLEELSGQNKKVIRNIAAYRNGTQDYSIEIIAGTKCGANKFTQYTNAEPKCKIENADLLLLTKPVLFNQNIVNLKVLMCAERK